MTYVRYLTALIFWLLASPVAANVITAASCSERDVRAALNSVTAATTQVNIPAGTCVWSSAKMVLNLPKGIGNLSILGAGNLNVTGGGGATTILDDLQDGSDALWAIQQGDSSRTTVVRIAGMTFRRNSGVIKPQGVIKYAGTNQLRVDHNTFDVAGGGLSMGSLRVYYATGVFDHNVSNGQVYVDFSGVLGQIEGNGDQGWAEPTNFGGSNFFFVEDNDFASIVSGRIQTIADCTHAGRVVVRFNHGNDTQQHGTYGGSFRARGCRAMEVYGNTFNGGNFNAVFLNSGPTLIWGNTQTQPAGGSYCCFITLHSPRSNNNSTTWHTPTPNGWGYCGSGFSGTGSNWDGNTDASSGYPCLDQLGRGQGDLLADQFPNTRNATTRCDSSRPCAWPRQALEPVYEWLNTTPFRAFTVYEPRVLQENRDYYAYTASFTGASGVGSGLLANRPATCTPKVAYWATDTKTLYQCASANTWTTYYRPYMYPHPLVGGSPRSAAPTNMTTR